MNNLSIKPIKLITLLLIAVGSFLFVSFNSPSGVINMAQYQILQESKLEINGKTNVNRFCCNSEEQFAPGKLKYQLDENTETIHFTGAQLKVKVHELDCGAKPINKDMREALQADHYPNIVIDLKRVAFLEGKNALLCNEWVQLEAVSDITLVCTTKSIYFPIQVLPLSANKWRIAGGTQIKLCDFGIEAPTALNGLIKVKDEMEINFDLSVQLSEAG